jgi:hypothetical protein
MIHVSALTRMIFKSSSIKEVNRKKRYKFTSLFTILCEWENKSKAIAVMIHIHHFFFT